MKKNEFTYKTGDGVTIVSSPDLENYYKNGIQYEFDSTKVVIPIEHPEHYNKGIECWDYIISHNMGFLEGNIIKYVTRYKHKNGKADLLKAKEYLDKLLEQVK